MQPGLAGRTDRADETRPPLRLRCERWLVVRRMEARGVRPMTIVVNTEFWHGPLRRATTKAADRMGRPLGLVLAAACSSASAGASAAAGAAPAFAALMAFVGSGVPMLIMLLVSWPRAWRLWKGGAAARAEARA